MMSNEDLIYRITRTVYDRLGAGAEEQAVEQLVTEIYRQVEPFLTTNGTSSFKQTKFAGLRYRDLANRMKVRLTV